MIESSLLLERRLMWEGCINVRDLGGLRTRDGYRTRRGALVRMDNPGMLSAQGVRAMLDYGVSTLIDLRYPAEIERYPHVRDALPADVAAPTVVHLPLLDEGNRSEEDVLFARSRDEWHEYVLDRRAAMIAAVFHHIATAQPGAVVLHCTAGKDRTGIISALVLDLVGVSRDDIVHDYAVSEEWLRPRTEQWLQPMDESQRAFALSLMSTAPAYMRHALNYLDARYGGTIAYLRQAGVSDATMHAVAARLIAC